MNQLIVPTEKDGTPTTQNKKVLTPEISDLTETTKKPILKSIAEKKGLEIYRKQLESFKLEGMSGSNASSRAGELLSDDEFTFEAGGKTYKARFGKRPPNVEVINE